jgi:hypothetical protein
MEDCSEKYCSYQKIKIDILSWNLAGVKIDVRMSYTIFLEH